MSNEKTAQENEETMAEQAEQMAEQQAASEPLADVGELLVEEQLAQALAENQQLREQMMREQAETQNIRKRLQRDVENARKFALEKFIHELLPVADNLDRAIHLAGDDDIIKPLLEGVEMTRKTFLDVLQKFNVEQVHPLGEPFNPEFHEAVAMVPNPAMEPNLVMDVMQKGYTLNGRLLRAAMVAVTKAP